MPEDSPSTATTTSARSATATASAIISCGERLSTGMSSPNALSVARSAGSSMRFAPLRVQDGHGGTGHVADTRLDADGLVPVAGGAPAAQQIVLVIRQRTNQRNGPGFLQGQDLLVVLQQHERLFRQFPRELSGFPA